MGQIGVLDLGFTGTSSSRAQALKFARTDIAHAAVMLDIEGKTGRTFHG
ncbi:MAG: hypothetical protein ACREQX_12500 [Candidatus Binataceae bacterium]